MKNFTSELSVGAYLKAGANKTVRTLSQLKDLYSNREEVNRILENEDPVLYEVFEMPPSPKETDLLVNITVLHAGVVGEEPFMTKGHFHQDPDTGEVVIGLKGSGILLLQNRKGEIQEFPVEEGKVSYAAGGWGHRVINTGKEDLHFLAISGANMIHDYETAVKLNFKSIPVENKERISANE